MNRRTFLRNMLTMPVAAASFLYGNPFRPGFSVAHAATNKTLIVIFQRGGCDGLNTIIPYGDDDYYRLRPTLAISPPSPSNSSSAIDLNHNFFGLHPALKPLVEIYQEGNLAMLPAVHYSNASTSHFEGQDIIESGNSHYSQDGWINRYLENSLLQGEMRAAGFGGHLPHSLRGSISVPTFNDLASYTQDDGDSIARLLTIIEQSVNPESINRTLLHQQSQQMVSNLNFINNLDVSNYIPDNGSTYPDSSLGKKLRQIAQLKKENIGLEFFTVDSENWDTHANQGSAEGHHADQHADLASGIAALYTDLGPSLMQDVVILTMTEFGRTAKENASGGTDHGNASAWFVIGGSVQGGIYGDWPGLNDENLFLGRYLAHNLDYSNVLSEIINKHFDASNILSDIFPRHVYKPIGFL